MTRILKILVILILLSFLIGLVWLLPILILEKWDSLPLKDLAQLEINIRNSIVQIVGGMAILIGLYLTYRRIVATEKSVVITQEGQKLDLFSRSIEHLGSDKLEIRLGGIYSLERIAHNFKEDHTTIVEILSTFIQQNSPLPIGDERSKNDKSTLIEVLTSDGDKFLRGTYLRTDIQACLKVLGRRKWIEKEQGRIELYLANLEGAFLFEPKLNKVSFVKSNLKNSWFKGGNFDGSWFIEVDLENAWFDCSSLRGADFRGANLQNTDFSGSDLPGARNLTLDQLQKAKSLYKTQLNHRLLSKIEKELPQVLKAPKVEK